VTTEILLVKFAFGKYAAGPARQRRPFRQVVFRLNRRAEIRPPFGFLARWLRCGFGALFAYFPGQSVTWVRIWEAEIMRNRSGWILTLGYVLIFAGLPRLRAQVVDKGAQEAQAIKTMVEESVDWYRVFSDKNAPDAMTPLRVLRWRNVTRGTQESEGVFVLWVNKGRPEALASIYPWEGNLNHDFASLSRDAKLVAREGGRVIWSPETPGVEFKDIPSASPPADTPAARLRQMKMLADRFKVTMTGWRADKSDREELRQLPKLLYRDELGDAPGPKPGWTDGGVFAFVQGTDPEAILVLEVVRQTGRPRWQYGFARATSGGLEARLDKTVVWAVDFLAGEATPLQPQMTLRRPLGSTASGR
jgi:hypothetical protein